MSTKMKKLHPAMSVPKKDWKGYTLSELRFQRALTLVRMDMASERLKRSSQIFDTHLNQVVAGNIFLRLFSNINFAEYAAIGIRTLRTVVRFWQAFRN